MENQMLMEQDGSALATRDDALVPVERNQVEQALSVPQRQPVPSIEAMLSLAIERGIDPAAMEKLVELHERVAARQAEIQFNESMSEFMARCPVILKNRTASDNGRKMYDYATLPSIMAVVDPILHELGLSYTFDFDLTDDVMTTTCTIHHIAGHRRSSKFSCKLSGTKIMNSAQMAGSATTYGRRYSLQGALGLCIDVDDDGRGAIASPAPSADPLAPRVGTRAERAQPAYQAEPGAPKVTATMLNDLMSQWARKTGGKTQADFIAWARSVLHTESKLALGDWSLDAVDVCKEALR